MKLKQWSIYKLIPGPVGYKRQVLQNFPQISVPILLINRNGGLFLNSKYDTKTRQVIMGLFHS